jgi:hypothetical protein
MCLCFNICVIEHLTPFSGNFIILNVLYSNLFKIPTLKEPSFQGNALLILQPLNNLNYKVLLGHTGFLEETPFLITYALKLIM